MRVFEQFKFLVADLKRWKCRGIKDVFYVILELGVWGTFFYRVGRALYLINIPILKIILRFIAFLIHKIVEILFSISIKPATDIGPGLYVGHSGGVIVHPQAKAGKNLSIGSGVVIGEKGLGKGGCPVLGDDVYVGVGAKILGDVKIGNNVKIGANAVVVKDLPDNVTAVGIPAQVIMKNE